MIPPYFLGSNEGAASGFAAAGGLFMFVVVFGLLFLAVVWIIFPFLVASKLNTLAKLHREGNSLLRAIAGSRSTEAPPALPKPPAKPPTPQATPAAAPDVYKL